jgi:hypothetical protein
LDAVQKIMKVILQKQIIPVIGIKEFLKVRIFSFQKRAISILRIQR